MTFSHIEYHIGVNPILYIGQAAFPIFAYLSAYAVDLSSDKYKYCKRILLYGLLLQIPLFIVGFTYINIFVTIGLGILSIIFIQRMQYYYLVPILLFAYFTNLDYGVFGISVIICAYLFKDKVLLFGASLTILQFVFINLLGEFSTYQWYSLLAILPLLLYNGELGYNKYKWWFYIYYPLHVVIIYLISIY